MKLLSSVKSSSMVTGVVVIALTTIVSKLIGLARDKLLANFFGPGIVLDAYFASFRIPDFIFNSLVLGVLGVALIPTLTSIKEKQKHDQVVSNILFIVTLVLLFLSIIGWIFAPTIVKLITAGFTDERLQLTIAMTRIMLFSVVVFGISNVLGCVLQAKKIFTSVALAGIFYNLGIIAGIIGAFLFGPMFLAWGVVLGSVLHLLTQVPNIIQFDILWMKFANFSHESLMVLKLMLPRIFGLLSGQFGLTFITSIISLMPVGSMSVYSLATNIQSVPYSVVAVAISVAAFPFMSESANNSKKMAQQHLNKLVKFQIVLLIPVITTIWVWRTEIVKILIGGGSFDVQAVNLTANILMIILFSVLPMAIYQLSARTMYALKNTTVPTLVSLLSLTILIITTWFLKDNGLIAVCLGLTIVDWFNGVLMYLLANKGNLTCLRSKWPYKVLISGFIGLFLQQIIWLWLNNSQNSAITNLIIITISGIISLLLYGLILKTFKVDEINKIIFALKILRKKTS